MTATMNSPINCQHVLDAIMQDYQQRVPQVAQIGKTLITQGIIDNANQIENDHIAFRSVCQAGFDALEQIFLLLGYRKMDYLHFAKKKLDAYWYAPPSNNLPRIFY